MTPHIDWIDEFYTFISALQVSNFDPKVQKKFFEATEKTISHAVAEEREKAADLLEHGDWCKECTPKALDIADYHLKRGRFSLTPPATGEERKV